MKSSQVGMDISASVENITPIGMWLFVNSREYFLSYVDFPFFKEGTLGAVQDVELIHETHLYWPQLDVDLEIDNLVNPQKYLLGSKITAKAAGAGGSRYLEKRARRTTKQKFKKVLRKVADREPNEADK